MTVDEPIERVVVNDDAVGLVYAAAGADTMVARADEGDFLPYPADMREALEGLPQLSSDPSREAIIAAEPDLYVGFDAAGVTTETLAEVGITMLMPSIRVRRARARRGDL
ncbi:MAG: hypothetical protein ACRDZO_15830 [Egibacteraceae bacterium]